MKMLKPHLSKLVPGLARGLAGMLAGCSNFNQAPDVSGNIRTSMEQAGLKDVKVSQERDKGVVTLSGNVTSEDVKAKAESLAKSMAGSQVVANQIAVLPSGAEDLAHKVNVDLHEGIESNLDAALIKDS